MKNTLNGMYMLYPISLDTHQIFISHLKKQIIPAKTIIINANQLDKRVYFIEKGITRSYSYYKEKELTSWFSKEGELTCSSSSFYRYTPGFEYVETLEECEVYSISVDVLMDLYAKHIDLANWGRVLAQEIFMHLQDRHLYC